MAWIRLSDNYVDHPKFLALSDGAFRLWHEALAYCRRHQTDGLFSFQVMKSFRVFTKSREKQLSTPFMPDARPLWDLVPAFGYRVHDYLDWNLSKEDEDQQREESRRRMAMSRDPELRRALHARDGLHCRYCGQMVSWTDRRGKLGATYDHVNPRGGDAFENLVIACRGCNSSKGARTPEQAMMELRPPPHPDSPGPDYRFKSRLESGLKSNSKYNLSSAGYGYGSEKLLEKKETENETLFEARAGQLLDKYQELFVEHRRGARYHARPHLDFPKACDLVRTWTDDERLYKLARIVLTTDDDWISRTDRGFAVFAAKATWADDRLREWEAAHV